MSELPKKLENDAIVEALCELQFESDESLNIPELVFGRLADKAQWQDYQNIRLPLADFPANVRAQTDEMKYAPVLELRSPDASRIVRIGSNVLSYHALAPYPGWDKALEKEMHEVVDHLFNKFDQVSISKIRLRYINILKRQEHQISSPSDLNFSLTVSNESLDVPQLISFKREHGQQHIALVQVASREFVSGPEKELVSALVDVDVSTTGIIPHDSQGIKLWLGEAHNFEKKEFFGLLTKETIDKLRMD